MRCFHIMKTTLEIKMTNFAFCDSLKASPTRGSVSGCPTDQQALAVMFEQIQESVPIQEA